MKSTSSRLKGLLAGAAAMAAVAAVVPFDNASALPPGTPPAGSVTLSPASGTSATVFSVSPPVGAACQGDSTTGYRYHSFIIPFGQDPADMTFTNSGTPNNKPAFRGNLANAIGTLQRNINPNLGDGGVFPINNLTFSSTAVFGSLTPGAYTVGIACTQPDAASVVQTTRFWSTDITISGTLAGGDLTYATGVAPGAPTITGVTPGNQTCTVAFTPGAGGATSFTVTGTPGGTATGAASPLTVTGLTNGTAYTFTVTGTNAVGPSPASAPSATCTPVAGPRTNVTGLTATPGAPGSGNITLNWTAPGPNTPAADPVSYAVSWTGPTPGSVTVPFGTNTYLASGLSTGNYVFTVVATYADSPTAGTPPATVSATASPSSIVIQDIDVRRPVGALVLTQVCNSNAAFAADTTPSLGFPNGVPAVAAENPSTVGNPTQTGTAPTTTSGGTTADPNFPEYPYPIDDATGIANPTYPTYCGIDLGPARFVTRGAGAGQFFATSGTIDQITVVDTRDDDTGWTVSGTMSTFSANGGTDTFSGSQLGWRPVVTDDTDAFTDSLGNTYDQVAIAGAEVQPNTVAASGLSSGATLMRANAGSSLGVAIADARLKLLIPVTADAGLYEGTLTFSAVGA